MQITMKATLTNKYLLGMTIHSERISQIMFYPLIFYLWEIGK